MSALHMSARVLPVLLASVALAGCSPRTMWHPTAAAVSRPSAPKAQAPRPAVGGTVVVAAGDIACPPGRRADARNCGQAATARLAASVRPAAVVTLGDEQYDAGRLADYRASYGPTWGRLLRRTHPAPGNHEYAASGRAAGYRAYFGARGVRAGTTWYSYDLAGWHLVALDSDCAAVGGCGRRSPQGRWFAADLRAHPTRCALAYWHHPRFSSGAVHGSSREVDALYAIAEADGVDLLLAGHDHLYERFAPQHHDGTPARRAPREFVVGTGGESLYPFGRPLPTSARRIDDTFGVLELRLRAADYGWNFRAAPSGAVRDTGTGACS